MNYKRWVPLIFKLYIKNQFCSKTSFSSFFNPDLRKEREHHRILVVERELSLTPIIETKTVDLNINMLYLVRRVSLRCFFTFKFLKKHI